MISPSHVSLSSDACFLLVIFQMIFLAFVSKVFLFSIIMFLLFNKTLYKQILFLGLTFFTPLLFKIIRKYFKAIKLFCYFVIRVKRLLIIGRCFGRMFLYDKLLEFLGNMPILPPRLLSVLTLYVM